MRLRGWERSSVRFLPVSNCNQMAWAEHPKASVRQPDRDINAQPGVGHPFRSPRTFTLFPARPPGISIPALPWMAPIISPGADGDRRARSSAEEAGTTRRDRPTPSAARAMSYLRSANRSNGGTAPRLALNNAARLKALPPEWANSSRRARKWPTQPGPVPEYRRSRSTKYIEASSGR